jgi:ribosome recycling factor
VKDAERYDRLSYMEVLSRDLKVMDASAISLARENRIPIVVFSIYLGLNPITEGQTIRVPLPDLTADRRKELTKVAHKYAEAGRVSIRNIRRDAMDHLKKLEKDGTISQDEQRKSGADVQSLTDEHIRKVDELLQAKEKDILQV